MGTRNGTPALVEAPRDLGRDGLLDFLAQFREKPALRRLLILVNLGGVAYGLYYYRYQFAVTPVVLWPFVPDSPLSVGLFALVLILDELKRESRLLELLAFVDLIKVGLWTGFVLLYYDSAFRIFVDPIANLDFYLFWLHLGMALEAFVLAKRLMPTIGRLSIAAALFSAELYMDYVYTGFSFGGCIGTRPITVPCKDNDLLGLVTLALTILGFGCALAIARRRSLAA